MNYLKQHLVEAIKINLDRRPYYTQKAGLHAAFLSRLMASSEYFSLLFFAPLLDTPAKKFIAQDINIIKDDFVDMKNILDVETPPIYSTKASNQYQHLIKKLVNDATTKSKEALKEGDFNRICEILATCLMELDKYEEESKSHFSMLKHLIESAGIAALHSQSYIAQDVKTKFLCYRLTKIQLDCIKNSVIFDELAQRCHAKGAGIIVNDVPPVPFFEEWKKLKLQ